MYVFCCGMRRSGSTLQYQLTKEIVERSKTGKGYGWRPAIQFMPPQFPHYQIIKCHGMIDLPGRAIFIYRDIRDVIVSLMNMYDHSFVRAMQELPAILNEYKQWTGRKDVLIQRYEDLAQGERETLARWVGEIADYLNIALSDRSFVRTFLLDYQRERMKNVLKDEEHNPTTLLRRNHIHSGKIGQWRQRLNPEQVQKIEAVASGWLSEQGYQTAETIT